MNNMSTSYMTVEHDTDDNNENNEIPFVIGEHIIIPGSVHV